MLNLNELKYLATKSAEGFGTMPEDAPSADSPKSIDSAGYGKATGLGAGAGAVAGIPISLLAHALMAGEDKRGLRDYLKSGLLGALVGGGLGAAGGAGMHYASKSREVPGPDELPPQPEKSDEELEDHFLLRRG